MYSEGPPDAVVCLRANLSLALKIAQQVPRRVRLDHPSNREGPG
jgi:hypothetical protein